MYCIKCGVELADSEKVCPLCGTRVYHPDIEIKTTEPPFPEYKLREPRMNLRGIMFIVTMIFAALIVQLVICNISISNASEWSGYAIGAVLLLYELVALPLWFKRPNPVIFVPCGFAAVLAYLLYIDLAAHGGWFLKFAFPVVGAYGLLVTAVVTLLKYVRRGHLYIFGGALIAHGIYMTFLEMMINIAFSEKTVLQLNWSYFPLFGCFILGMGLIIVAIIKPMQESLKKKFFV